MQLSNQLSYRRAHVRARTHTHTHTHTNINLGKVKTKLAFDKVSWHTGARLLLVNNCQCPIISCVEGSPTNDVTTVLSIGLLACPIAWAPVCLFLLIALQPWGSSVQKPQLRLGKRCVLGIRQFLCTSCPFVFFFHCCKSCRSAAP